MTIGYGMTTARRDRDPDGKLLRASLESVAAAGFPCPVLIGDCATWPADAAGLANGMTGHDEPSPIGPWPNFRAGIRHLTSLGADAVWMFQDDIELTTGIADRFDFCSSQYANVGVLSLYCSQALAHATANNPGCRGPLGKIVAIDSAKLANGALAVYVSKPVCEVILNDPPRPHSRTNIERGLFEACQKAGLPYWVHSPSLCRHKGGDASTLLDGVWPLTQWRQAGEFRLHANRDVYDVLRIEADESGRREVWTREVR